MQMSPRLRFGVVGLSSDHVWMMGDGLAAQPDVKLVAAADADPGLLGRAAQRWDLARTYPACGDLLAACAVDAVLVCCDNGGKADVVEAAASRGIGLMVTYHHVFNPLYEELTGMLRDGALGTVYLARGAIGHAGPREYGCSDEFCSWLFDAGRNGGGCFIAEGCYLIAEFVDRLGKVAEVSAFTAQIGHHSYLPADVEDNAVAILRFASGALGLIDAKWGQAGPAPLFTSYHGVDGTLSVYDDRAELATALHVQEVIDAVYASARTGEAVRIGQ